MSSKKNIELLLTDNIDNLGIVGDVVKVKAGYARNYLLPTGLADAPTPGNKKRVEARRLEVQKEIKDKRNKIEAIFAKLEDVEITLARAANEDGLLYGSVSQHDIAEALHAEGFTGITDRDVRIGELIKHLDSYEIPVQLAADLKTTIKLWVVSDKPSEELRAEMERTEEDTAKTEDA